VSTDPDRFPSPRARLSAPSPPFSATEPHSNVSVRVPLARRIPDALVATFLAQRGRCPAERDWTRIQIAPHHGGSDPDSGGPYEPPVSAHIRTGHRAKPQISDPQPRPDPNRVLSQVRKGPIFRVQR
jgi:hypothetical protein